MNEVIFPLNLLIFMKNQINCLVLEKMKGFEISGCGQNMNEAGAHKVHGDHGMKECGPMQNAYTIKSFRPMLIPVRQRAIQYSQKSKSNILTMNLPAIEAGAFNRRDERSMAEHIATRPKRDSRYKQEDRSHNSIRKCYRCGSTDHLYVGLKLGQDLSKKLFL